MRCALACWIPALLSAKMATIAGGYFPPKYYMDFVTPVVVPDFGSLLVSPPLFARLPSSSWPNTRCLVSAPSQNDPGDSQRFGVGRLAGSSTVDLCGLPTSDFMLITAYVLPRPGEDRARDLAQLRPVGSHRAHRTRSSFSRAAPRVNHPFPHLRERRRTKPSVERWSSRIRPDADRLPVLFCAQIIL